MKLDPKRTQIPVPYPSEVQKALFTIGDFLNNYRAGDIAGNFTIHRNGESITYEFATKEIKRQPTYIEGEDLESA
jgi:hypothetical protein